MAEDYVRVLRVVEYIGPREWVETTVAGSIHGTRWLGTSKCIRAATIGSYPELLDQVTVNSLEKKDDKSV